MNSKNVLHKQISAGKTEKMNLFLGRKSGKFLENDTRQNLMKKGEFNERIEFRKAKILDFSRRETTQYT